MLFRSYSYSQYIYFSESYEASRALEPLAAEESDFNSASASQTQQLMGKGHRNKRPKKRFLVDESQHSSSDAESSVGMYGATQFETPPIPPGFSSNAVQTTRQVGNGPSPTQFFQQIEESNCLDSLVTVPSMPVNTQLTVERAHANALERTESPSLLNINSTSSTLNRQLTLHHDQFFAHATNTEGEIS